MSYPIEKRSEMIDIGGSDPRRYGLVRKRRSVRHRTQDDFHPDPTPLGSILQEWDRRKTPVEHICRQLVSAVGNGFMNAVDCKIRLFKNDLLPHPSDRALRFCPFDGRIVDEDADRSHPWNDAGARATCCLPMRSAIALQRIHYVPDFPEHERFLITIAAGTNDFAYISHCPWCATPTKTLERRI